MPFPKQASCGKCIPEFQLETGCAFPVEGLWETVSHLEGQNWDAVSGHQNEVAVECPRWRQNVTCAGLAGTPKGTLQRPTSVMECRAAPISDALPAYQAMKIAIALDDRRDAGKVQIQRNDCHDNDHCRDQLIVQVRKHRLTAASLACNVDGDGRSKKDRCDHDALEAR